MRSQVGMMMPRLLLDTNHAGLLLRDDRSLLWNKLGSFNRDECSLCRPVVAELWFMVFNSQRAESNRTRLEQLLAQFDIIEFDAAAAIEFGRLQASLRSLGKSIPVFDVLIASIARVNDCTLVTADAHFSYIHDLRLENWIH